MIKRVERKDGTVRWEVYAKRDKRKVYVGSAETEKAAKALEGQSHARQQLIASGELPAAHDIKRTLGESLDTWLSWLESTKARSHRAYSEFVKYQIRPSLGVAILVRLDAAQIEAWLESLRSDYAASTINSALGCLSSACSWFKRKKWISANPCQDVEPIKMAPRSYRWIRTRGELERLLSVCPDELRDMIAVSVGTMLRIDETLHLQWVDIDFDLRLITIQRGRQGMPKSGRIRHVPILDSVLPILKRRALQRGGATLIFPGKKGAVRAKTPVQVAFKSALRRAGMDTKLRWHDLRHTGASWWVLGGGDLFRLSKLLGHSSVLITQKTYAHLAPEAWQHDYGRLAFHCPDEPAKVYEFIRDENGKLAGKRAVRPDGATIELAASDGVATEGRR